jgi:response regulator RpfG family c-di-GMP phosphodiesterase
VKILIVDDEQLDLFINKKLLSLEFEVEGFTSLNDAITWAQNNTFDVALIDYYLGPNLYAHNALSELKAIKKGESFKAFVLSNFVDAKQSSELREAGFIDIIYKPLTLESFKSKIS